MMMLRSGLLVAILLVSTLRARLENIEVNAARILT